MTIGGIEWEQGSAVTGMVEAIRANDPDAMGRSMADYAAALGTRTTSILSGLVAQVLTELHDMRAERSSGARTMDHKLDMIMTAVETTQLDTARRLDAMSIDMDTMRTKMRTIRDDVRSLAHETIQDELQREERLQLTSGLRVVLSRWPEVEKLLDNHGAAHAE